MLTNSKVRLNELVTGNTQFALELYRSVNASGGNLFLSPWSISTALGMVFLGARGETASQMARCLHFVTENEEPHQSLARLKETLIADSVKGNVDLRIANKLWGQHGFSFLNPFLDTLERSYASGLQAVDFSRRQETCNLINRWVEQQTENLIRDILTEDAINELTRLVLANAIYFKGKWTTPFEEQYTENRPFFLESGETIRVPMMGQLGPCKYAKLSHLRVLEKPYGEGEFSMAILLPDKKDGLAALEDTLSHEQLDAWLKHLEPGDRVDILMPKFRIESWYELGSTLAGLGMVDLFTFPAADLSGMTGKKDLVVSEVIHKAFVEVEEKGTRAAAATVVEVVFAGLSEPTPRPRFHADHPFLFLIRHNSSGTILFLGRVMDPRTD